MDFIRSSRSLAFSPRQFVPGPNQWVQLRDAIADGAHHEALLLCSCGRDQWIAWIPDYGQAQLHRHQFLQGQA